MPGVLLGPWDRELFIQRSLEDYTSVPHPGDALVAPSCSGSWENDEDSLLHLDGLLQPAKCTWT